MGRAPSACSDGVRPHVGASSRYDRAAGRDGRTASRAPAQRRGRMRVSGDLYRAPSSLAVYDGFPETRADHACRTPRGLVIAASRRLDLGYLAESRREARIARGHVSSRIGRARGVRGLLLFRRGRRSRFELRRRSPSSGSRVFSAIGGFRRVPSEPSLRSDASRASELREVPTTTASSRSRRPPPARPSSRSMFARLRGTLAA